jgi:hypothetical protein
MCMLTDTTYNDYDTAGPPGANGFFYPDAPPFPPVAPVKPRATPYVGPPTQCAVNFRTGTITCFDGGPMSSPFGFNGFNTPPFDTFGTVYGGSIVNEPFDSPLNRILQRQPAGPWQLVGAAISEEHTAPRERTMMVYAQAVDTARDRYNYRVIDGNNVPLDLGQKVRWKTDGERLFIPGYPGHYRLMLYNQS